MKSTYKNWLNSFVILTITAILTTSCSFEEETDPNGPSLEGLETDANLKQLNEIMIGLQSTVREGLGVETITTGVLARELYLFDADPRNTGDLLGKNGITLDNNSYYSVTPFTGNYQSIKNVSVVLNALENTQAIEESQKNAYRGFANTFKAYELIQILKSYGRARIDTEDFDNLGPFLEFDEALAEIRQLLEEAQNDLSSYGDLDQFLFPVFGCNDLIDRSEETDDNSRENKNEITINEFIQFNRAVASVAALYAGDGDATLNALENSYFDLDASLDLGTKHIFSQNSGDLANPVFRAPSTESRPNNGDQIIVNDDWIEDAETGDSRVAEKTKLRPNPSVQDGLTGAYESSLYASNVASIDIIRNEELILVYAEANILTGDLEEAEDALNVIRNAANLPDYDGESSTEALTAEMLKQRRYSLWSENHRMFDLRRYNLSETLPAERDGDRVYNILPIPLAENL